MDLKKRCRTMIDILGIPVSRFCKNINLSAHSFYDWQNGKVELSENRLESIQKYLEKYNF